MMVEKVIFPGCTPTPLANYLKALGVLRLIASSSSSATGIAADADVRGCWMGRQFQIHTSLNHEALIQFFLNDYMPSPIVAPWNGGSGFYPKDNKDGFGPFSKLEDVASRFEPIANAIQAASEIIERRRFSCRPQDAEKIDFIMELRGCLSDSALDWLDATLALSGDGVSFPPLLGTGGNDGRLDFTNNFMRRLVSVSKPIGLFNAATGEPMPHTGRFLRASLFADAQEGMHKIADGQFAPGSAGGPNASTDYEGDQNVNPWDLVLTLEGAIMFAGAATRRHEGSRQSNVSFPFIVSATGTGWGGIAHADESDARAEFWAPLWTRPVNYGELMRVLSEGRAILRGKTVRDGLDFARAAVNLGVSRGIDAFQRYGFVMRSGKSYLAVPIGTRKVALQASGAAELISNLDIGGWLGRVRRLARRQNMSARAREAIRKLEDALFSMTEENGFSAGSIQSALIALGGFMAWVSQSENVHESISPPPQLSWDWVHLANDGTAEFRIAAALASIGWQGAKKQRSAEHAGRNVGSAPTTIAMAAHFAPVDLESIFQKQRFWDSQSKQDNHALVVWSANGLTTNLVSILERRLVEMGVRGMTDKPIDAAVSVGLADITTFLDPNFNDARCARLLSGLVWAKPAHLPCSPRSGCVIPFSYAALKPIFSPDCALQEAIEGIGKSLPKNFCVPVPPDIVTRLRCGMADVAIRIALERMRASNIPSPFFSSQTVYSDIVQGRRLAAAQLIPLNQDGLKAITKQVYLTEMESKNAT